VRPGHRDTVKWNARYSGGPAPSFAPHPLAAAALSLRLPEGPVLELASGPSGSALLAAAAGREVTAVDASDVALGLLGAEAARRGLRHLITLTQADLQAWRPAAAYPLVLCTGYWDRDLFAAAAAAVAAGGLLAWEALTQAARTGRPSLDPAWCLGPGEPFSLLPAGFAGLRPPAGGGAARAPGGGSRRQLLARRRIVR
jgi:hypothetical protein